MSLSPHSQRLRPFRATPFGRYTLLMPLSSGGMGEIFLARMEGAQGFEKLCVIKKILPHLAAQPQFLERFGNEAKTLVKLAHGSIAQVLDMGLVEGEPFLAIEYVDGKDMRKVAARMRDRGMPTPLTVVLMVMIRVLDALAYAHRKRDDDDKEIGLVHRDVSPQNILVSYEGEVRIVDFGLAKSTLNSGTTSPSIVLGKFLYMSPEQARNAKVDRRSDLYSAGLCLYELISGRNPFEELPHTELMAAVSNPKIPSLRTLDPLCPAEIEAVVMKAIAVDPAHRFQTAEELRGKLSSLLSTIDPSAGPESLSRFMRDTFAAEHQQERKLLATFREQRRILPVPAAVKDAETAVRQGNGPSPHGAQPGSTTILPPPPVLTPSDLGALPSPGTARTKPAIEAAPLSFTPTPRTAADRGPLRDGETLPSIVIDDSLTMPGLQAPPQPKRAELNWSPPTDDSSKTALGPPDRFTAEESTVNVEERTEASVPISEAHHPTARLPSLESTDHVVLGTLLEAAPPSAQPPDSKAPTHPDFTTSDLVPIVLDQEVGFASQTLPPDEASDHTSPGHQRARRRAIWPIAVPLVLLTLAVAGYFAWDLWRSGLGRHVLGDRPPPPGGRESTGDTEALPKREMRPLPGSEELGPGPEGEPEAVAEPEAAAPEISVEAPTPAPPPAKESEVVAPLAKKPDPKRVKKVPKPKLEAVAKEWKELRSTYDAVVARIGCGDERTQRACASFNALQERKGDLATAAEADAFVSDARSLRKELRRKLEDVAP